MITAFMFLRLKLYFGCLLLPIWVAAQKDSTDWQTADWIGQVLQPQQNTLTLKEVVIPGSHDAGMSILTATGGIQSSSINECNTLTQVYPVAQQLEQGIRMFDLRIGKLNGKLYTKHCSSNCMEDAMGGGYGESLPAVVNSIRNFLNTHKQEFVLLSFTHFCDKEISAGTLAQWLQDSLGRDYILDATPWKHIGEVPLKKLCGKSLLLFEKQPSPPPAASCTFDSSSGAFVNFNRAYAATNNHKILLAREKQFFTRLRSNISPNDLVRLDWQLTQSSDEAAMICNDFQSERTGLALDMTMLLTNLIRGHKSIITLSHKNNQRLQPSVESWIADGTITHVNKPNILYVDVAGKWITEYCVKLNRSQLYSK